MVINQRNLHKQDSDFYLNSSLEKDIYLFQPFVAWPTENAHFMLNILLLSTNISVPNAQEPKVKVQF